MDCYICKKNVDNEDLSDILPIKLKHAKIIVHCCKKHHGIVKEYNRQNPKERIEE